MFDLDLNISKFFRQILGLAIFVLIITADIFILFKSWGAVLYKLKDVDIIIKILAIIGASVITFIAGVVTLWITLILIIFISKGLLRIH